MTKDFYYEVQKFRKWLDTQAIVEIVYQALKGKKVEPTFKNMRITWLDALGSVGEEIPNWIGFLIDADKIKVKE